MNDVSTPRPVQLHVIHDLGGGSGKWLADYVQADSGRTNLILRSFAHDTAAGAGISLHDSPAADAPALKLWKWTQKIAGTAAAHAEWRAAFQEILREYAVDGILVSSFIGHSLEALDTGLPTLVVNHDYFPYCPAINLYFQAICGHCNKHRIAECDANNPKFNAFAGWDPLARHEVRERFVEYVHRPNVTMVAPSRSISENLKKLDARFHDVRFVTIPHGYGAPLRRPANAEPGEGRLRVLVLGQLSVAKGVELLRATVERITNVAELYLVGTKELGEEFRDTPHVHVVSDYDIEELPGHVAAIRPHLGLLMSIVPETFSYALSELMMLGVPAAVTRLGSFVERIRDGDNGYLYDPIPDGLMEVIRRVDGNRAELERVRANVARWRPATAAEMVAEYHRVLPLSHSAPSAAPVAGAPAPLSPEVAAQALAVASMWKDLKASHRQIALLNEARERWHAERLRLDEHRASLERRIATANRQWVEMDAALGNKEMEVHRLQQQIDALEAEIAARDARVAEIFASSSWRISAPVRWIGKAARNVAILARCTAFALRHPADLGTNLRKASTAWREGGIPGLKSALLGWQNPASAPPDAWQRYQAEYRGKVRPRLAEKLKELPRRPLVSILLPTYNTPAEILEETLASVEEQLYPEWELCVADDGSTEPHVAKILKAHAERDKRIKLDLSPENRGVSRASNRALALATGEVTVLLDHDDVLEEQAIFRVAEAAVEDDPDMMYSDEVHVTHDGGAAQRFVYRPAFSLEYLRSHPYIIHLVAFRTALLREIGGFDERMRISQDYDLILRAVEKARRITHIPLILYRWRIHGSSAGHARMHEVTEVSTLALQRHLDRCGVEATAYAGPAFNVYEVRYRLVEEVRVAIIIPTKNHGNVLRQCIDSIRETVKGVRYDIIVVNHDSDDPETIAYLSSLAPPTRVIRYSGAFNFSAINNYAVSKAGAAYTHYLFCNNDIEAIEEGWLERMAELGQQANVGIVGAKLLYPGRRNIQHAGVLVGAYGAAEHYGKFMYARPEGQLEPGYGCNLIANHELSAVTAACLLMRRDAFEAIGGFDEAMAVGFGDVDLCLRTLQRGYRVVFCANATLVHHESLTRGSSNIDPHPEDTAEFRRRWSSFLAAGDPYYSPGLSTSSTGWDVRHPLPCEAMVKRRVYTHATQPGAASSKAPHAADRIKVEA
jgi:GT2 family glycosyltransferase/glycosyltransferase involved in cell wall biosynthesis